MLQQSPWAHQEVFPTAPTSSAPDMSIPVGNTGCDPDAIDNSGNCTQKRLALPVDPSRQREAAPMVNPSTVLLVRWESVTPVVQAFARLEQLGARSSIPFQAPPTRLPADRYVLTVKVFQPARLNVDPFAGITDDAAKQGAWLKASGGKLAPLEVERTGVGASLAIHFFFPRAQNGTPLLHAGRETVEFYFHAGSISVKSKFVLDSDTLR